jgi:5-methylthioribose kinase
MSTETEVASSYPGTFFLDRNNLAGIDEYLRGRKWIDSGEVVRRAERAGEGNMNCTLRIQTSERGFILKQARPWVEKYPHIPAPWNRAKAEAGFYQQVQANGQVSSHMPKLLGFDSVDRVLMLEDLGSAQDFTFVYGNGGSSVEEADLGILVHYLVALHRSFRDCNLAEIFSNTEMRALNHEHIFALPLRHDNGLDLEGITPGLTSLALELQSDSGYQEQVKALGECYLGDSRNGCLVHGDYFPGSWLKLEQRLYVIDPEFCFYGPPEWDIGVMIGHLCLAGVQEQLIAGVSNLYTAAMPVKIALIRKFAGVEIMRRLIGVAQLPLRCDLNEKRRLLELSRRLVVN